MARFDSEKGFTLMELVVVIAILAILAAISCLFYFRNLDRPKASLNATNLRAARTMLKAELLLDPDHPEEAIDRVLKGAPTALGVDLPGLSVPAGTPMDAVVGDDGVDTFYGGFNAEDFENPDRIHETEAETEAPTESVFCPVLTCDSTDLMDDGYCNRHQIRTCEKLTKVGDIPVLCGREFRDVCAEEHYKWVLCGCPSNVGRNEICGYCRHDYHGRDRCSVQMLKPDNSTHEESP